MIKSIRGHVVISGTDTDILAEFACICKALLDDGHFTPEELEDGLEMAQWPEEELDEKLCNSIGEHLAEALEDILNEIKGDKK